MPVTVHSGAVGSSDGGAVVLLHERYGLVQHSLDLAARFAAAGHWVATPDLFYDVEDQEGLRRGDARVDPADSRVFDLLDETLAVLRQASGDSAKLAMIGVCQTGRYPLLMAERAELDACVLLYGGVMDWQETAGKELPLADVAAGISAPILGIFGEKDHTIPVDAVLELRDCLERMRLSYRFHLFADMPHGWLNSTMPGRYREPQAEAAISEILEFLGETLSAGPSERPVEWSFTSEIARDYDFKKNLRFE